MNDRIRDLVTQLREIESGRPWIGSSFKRKLDLVDTESFFRRPSSNLHSIAEILSHLTVWREETLVKMKTGKGALLDDDPSNWRDLEELQRIGRPVIQENYAKSLDDIIDLLKSKEDQFLDENYYDPDFKGNFTYAWLLHGMLHHDVYHLGQVGQIIKLLNERNADK